MTFTPNSLLLYALILAGCTVGSCLFSIKKKRFAALLRIFTLLSLIASYIGVSVETGPAPDSGLLLVDVSDSMDPDTADSLMKSLQADLRGTTEISVVPFGAASASTGKEHLPDAIPYRALRDRWTSLDIGSSNLEQALRNAANTEKVYLLSDGFENGGDVTKVFDELKTRGIKIYPITPALDSDQKAQFVITQLHAPLIAAASSSVDIRITVTNTTSEAQSGEVIITHDKKELRRELVLVPAGKEKLIIVPSDPSKEGIKEIRAELRPQSSGQKISSEVIYLSGEKRDKVLLVSGSSDDERLLANVLSDQSYQVTRRVAQDSQTSLPTLSDFRTVIFNNVALRQLEAMTPEAVRGFVERGGGFLMIGGNKSFGLGGYKESAIETALPVSMVPPQTEQKRLNVAVQLVLDKSQSMAAENKIEFVKEAARETIRSLKNDDFIGVIPFDSVPFLLIRMSQVGQVRNEAMDKLSRIFPTGSTNLMPALQAAKHELERVPAGRKHIIILTDGKLPDAARGHFWYIEQVKQLRITGVTVSTVMLGPESDTQLLREIAQTGGGSFYQTADPNRLPQIFISDIKVSTGEKTLKESSEYDVRRGPSGITSTSLENFPPVLGYVQTKIKDGAHLELLTYAEQSAEPLLASWQYGKGRAVAFTSDANGRWSRKWAEWPRFREFWRDIVEATKTKSNETSDVRFELRPFIERGHLALDLAVFSPNVSSGIDAEISLPSGQKQKVAFERISDGHYRGYVDRPLAGRYELQTKIQGKAVTAVAFALSGESFGEQKHKGFNRPLLERIASETRGEVNPAIDVLNSKTVSAPEYLDISYVPLLLALAFIILEIYLREVLRVKPL